MATEEAKTVGSMPPPPAYYKLFAPKATTIVDGDGSTGLGTTAAAAASSFPLKPPPVPGPGTTYKMFGVPYSTEPVAVELLPPEKMVVPPAGEPVNFRDELKKLLDSIMANYDQFMEMLVSSPSHAHEKLSDVETLFVNMHSLLNRYRAHQARHLLLERLRMQAEEHSAVTSALKAAMEECRSEQSEAARCLVEVTAAGASDKGGGGGGADSGAAAGE